MKREREKKNTSGRINERLCIICDVCECEEVRQEILDPCSDVCALNKFAENNVNERCVFIYTA